MNKLKRLALSFTLTSILAAAAFAGETNTPPCVPGETHSPPCTTQSVNHDSTTNNDLTALGETSTPPTSNTALAVTDLAEAVFWALSLF